MLRITPFHDSDFSELLQLNLIDQNKWWHINANHQKQEPATWDELTPFERYVHGGPWLDPQTLHLHIKTLYESEGQIFLAKNENNQVVGEIELAQGTTILPGSTISLKKTHLIWFLVHPDYRRQGIGEQLFQQALTYTKTINASFMQAEPEDERSLHFYEKKTIKKYDKLVFTITPDTWEPEGHSFPYKEIAFQPFYQAVTTMYRITGTFYITEYDLYRIKHVNELHDILQDQPMLFKFIKIPLNDKHAYAILSSRPRLWIPLNTNSKLITKLLSFIIEESFIYGPSSLEIQVNAPDYQTHRFHDLLGTPDQIIPSFLFFV